MNRNCKITLYIPCRNYGHYLKAAIESVFRQHSDGWELILIDNQSTDNSLEIMRLYEGDLRVRIFRNEGTSIASAANLAIREARGEYLMRLDADDVLDENALLILANFLDLHPDYALVFPDYYLMDSLGNIFAHERRQSLYQKNHLLDLPPNGACTMIRLSILRKIGGYNERLDAQDGLDIWARVKNEFKCGNVNLPLFYYRRHTDNMTEDNSRIFVARRQIKKEMVAEKIKGNRPITVVIPCRRLYDFRPDLWSAKVGGKTLLDIAISNCIRSDLLDKIVITSDNPAVQDVLKSYPDSRLRFVERSTQNTLRSKPIAETLEQVVRTVSDGMVNGISVLYYIQAPFVTVETVEESITTLLMNDADASVAVQEIQGQVFRRTPVGMTPVNHYGEMTTDFDKIYNEVRVCIALKNSNLKSGSLLGSKTVNFEIPKEESFFIHTKRDLDVARILLLQEEARE